MKANAPEKLYLSKTIYNTYLYHVPDPDDETAVEYTCTDTFIEKVEEFLYEKLNSGDMECGDIVTFISDFKKYLNC